MTPDVVSEAADTYSLPASASPQPPLIVGVVGETFPGDRRVALSPASIASLRKAKFHVIVQTGAGEAAGFRDDDYKAQSAEILADRNHVFARADVLVHARAAGANPVAGQTDISMLRAGQTMIG